MGLCLSGGGMRGFELLGALSFLEKVGCFRERFAAYGGASIGAIITVALSMKGMTVSRLFDTMLDARYTFDFVHFREFESKLGLDSGKAVDELLNRIFEGDEELTLAEFERKHGVTVVVAAVDVLSRRVEYLRAETHGGMKVVTALRASAAIPFLITPVEWEDRLFVDGGLVDNFPVRAVNEGGRVFGVRLRPSVEAAAAKKKPSFLDFVGTLLNIVFDAQARPSCAQDEDRLLVLDVPCEGGDFALSMNFKMDADRRRELFQRGRAVAAAWCEANHDALSSFFSL